MNEIKQEEIKPKIKKSISVPKLKIDKEMEDYISNFDKQKELESFDKIYNEKIKKLSIKKPKTPKKEVKKEELIYKEALKQAPKLKNIKLGEEQTPEERKQLDEFFETRQNFIESYIRKNKPKIKNLKLGEDKKIEQTNQKQEIKPIETNKKQEVFDFIDNVNKFFISNRKEMFKTEEQKKQFRELVESQEFNDFYQTPDETSKYIYDEIKKMYVNGPCNILDPCCGLLSLSKRFINELNYKIYLNDINSKFIKIIKPLESSNVIINNDNFLMDFKKYYNKDIDTIICNPPFSVFMEVSKDKYSEYSYGYLLFIYVMYKIIRNNRKKYYTSRECYYILPKTLFKNDSLNIPTQTKKTVLGYFLKNNLITKDEYEEDLVDNWWVGTEFIKDVKDFKKLSKGKPTKMGLTCGLYLFMY